MGRAKQNSPVLSETRYISHWNTQWEEDGFESEYHDVDPRNDYEVRLDQLEHPWIKDELIQKLLEDHIAEAKVFPIREGIGEGVGAFMTGSCEEAYIVVNIDAHNNIFELKDTVVHELTHAKQEYEDRRFCEYEAEANVHGWTHGLGGLEVEKIIGLRYAYHVGSLDKEDKNRFHTHSQEGNAGISISDNPEKWRRIAQLGGAPVWRVITDYTSEFVNYHLLDESDFEKIKVWADSKNLFKEIKSYQVTSWDDEDETDYISLFDTLEEAEQENFQDRPIEQTTRLKATSALKEKVKVYDDEDITDQLVILWAEEKGFDGVWWEDAPGALSSPRGTIFDKQMDRWHVEKLPEF